MSYWTAMLGGQISYCDVGGISTRILQAGNPDDRLILCIHGSGGHAENFVTNVVPLSVAGYVVAPDLLGHGLTARPPEASYTMRGVIDHLKLLLQHFGTRPVTLIGLSLGGVFAAHLSVECSESVDNLIMICPSGLVPGPVDHQEITTAAAQIRDATKIALEKPTWENCRLRLARLVSNPDRIPEEMIELRQFMYTRPGYETMLDILQDNVDNIDEYIINDGLLQQIKARTLLIWGRHNADSVTVAEKAVAELEHGELTIFEDSGHWPHYEEQEAFHHKVLQFLDHDSAITKPGNKQ